jgi:uncharacterized protein (TIGR03546 family)
MFNQKSAIKNQQSAILDSGFYCFMNQRTRPWWENFWRGLRHTYKKVLRVRSSPHDVALGLALGVFIGLLPIIPFQSATALALAIVLRCSKLTALAGTLISNPLNIGFLYYIMFKLGHFFLPNLHGLYTPEHWTMSELLQVGWHVFGTMLLGGVILGLPSAIITYFLTHHLIKLYHTRRAQKMLNSSRSASPESNAP